MNCFNRFLTIIATLTLNACIETAGLYDAQVTSGSERRSGGGCAAPSSKYAVMLGDNVKMLIEARSSKNVYVSSLEQHFSSVFFLSLDISVPKDQRVRLEKPTFHISSLEFKKPVERSIDSFRLTVYGMVHKDRNVERGYTLTFPPTAELVGGHQLPEQVPEVSIDHFTSSFHVPDVVPQQFTLKFPRFLVNGKYVQPEPVTFFYREESYWMCLFS